MVAFTSYDVVGKKEDISDVISNISPTKTPFQSMIGNEKVNNVLFQWQEDSLASPNLSNAQVDGFVATDFTPVATVMRLNYTQILSKTVNVAETTDAVSRYGRAKETAYQLAKFSAEVKRDFEAILLSAQTAVVGAVGTARNLASFQAQLASGNVTKTGAAGTLPTEANLLAALQGLYVNGVDPEILLIPPVNSIQIAGFASAAGRYRTIPTEKADANMTIVNAVDLYVSPFGQVKVMLDRFQPVTDNLIYSPEYWKMITLRPWSRETLAKVGDSTRMMIVGEFSLKHKNYSASWRIQQSA